MYNNNWRRFDPLVERPLNTLLLCQRPFGPFRPLLPICYPKI